MTTTAKTSRSNGRKRKPRDPALIHAMSVCRANGLEPVKASELERLRRDAREGIEAQGELGGVRAELLVAQAGAERWRAEHAVVAGADRLVEAAAEGHAKLVRASALIEVLVLMVRRAAREMDPVPARALLADLDRELRDRGVEVSDG